MIVTPEGEPVVDRWQVRSLLAVADEFLSLPVGTSGRPCIVAVDGRSGSGKSTFAARLCSVVPDCAVLHSDDVAWWESFFDWQHLMVEGVLEPARRGEAVRYRPPAWDRRSRPGAIEVPVGATMVLIEGVGVGRRSLDPYLDASVPVGSPRSAPARRQTGRRVGGRRRVLGGVGGRGARLSRRRPPVGAGPAGGLRHAGAGRPRSRPGHRGPRRPARRALT